MSAIQQHLDVVVCENPTEAIRQGYLYREPVFKPISIDKVVVVKNGTTAGSSTVDIILVDDDGQKYVVMLTSKLLKLIPL